MVYFHYDYVNYCCMIDLKRFRTENNIKQEEICQLLGVSQPYISNMEKGNRPLNEEKFSILYNHYGDIILKYKIDERPIIISNGEQIKNKLDSQEKKLIPFYDDVATIGGNNHLVADVSANGSVPEWIDAGDWFPEATAAIRHYGDSMIEYPSGTILALKRVEDWRLIIWGRNYVIETTEFRITKRLQDGGDNYILAYSSNTSTYPDGTLIHSPIKIPKETIRHIDLVLGCVTKEYSNGPIKIIK